MSSRVTRWLPWLQAGIAVVLVAAILAPLIYALIYSVTTAGASSQDGRIHLNSKNTTRYAGNAPEDIAAIASEATFAGSGLENAIEVPFDHWQAVAVAASQARNEGAALLPGEDQLTIEDRMAGALDSYRSDPAYPAAPPHVIVVADDAALLAAPFVAWSSFSGAPLLVAGEEGIPSDLLRTAEEMGIQMFVVGPEVSEETVEQLESIADTNRVGDDDPVKNALEVAEYQTRQLVGWGYSEDDDDIAFHNYHLASVNKPELAVWAGALAGRGKMGPLLLTEDELPEQVEAAVWSVKPDWVVAPSEGPFGHITVVGSLEDISWEQQGELDWAFEIQNYVTQGPGLSSLEAIAIGWIVLSLCSGAWLFLNSLFRLPAMTPLMRMMWGLFGVVTGPLAVLVYVLSYHRRTSVMSAHGMSFKRTFMGETAVATAMGVAFGAPIMIAAAFFLAIVGMPLFVFDGGLFWLGNSMVVMMVLMWVVAVAVAGPVFQLPMLLSRGAPMRVAARNAALSVVISMTAVSVGMMMMTWFFQMWGPWDLAGRNLFVMMMQTEETVLFSVALLGASVIGYFTAFPFNALLVNRGWRPGIA